METFTLRIATPDGSVFDGDARSVVVRTTEGDVGILPRHIRYVGTIDFGMVRICFADGTERAASCMNGFVSVGGNEVRIVATTFEYSDEIDVARAQRAKETAEARLREKKSEEEVDLAQMKLKRALNRLYVSGFGKK